MINEIFFLFAAAILFLITFSKLLQRCWMQLPLLALGYGFLLGPHGLGLIGLPSEEQQHLLMEEAARLTLAIGLMGVALRLPKNYWRKHTRFIVVILLVGMPLMWAVSSLLLWWWLDVSLLVALLVGAIMTPTDPIVSTPIVTGDIADKNIPTWQQQGISAESGMNDGLGFIFVALPVYLLTKSTGEAWTHWFVHGWLHELGVAAVVGLLAGLLAARLLRWADENNEIMRTGYLGFTLALPIVVMTATRLLHADGVLAAFIAGAVLDQGISSEHQEHEEEIQEAVNKFFTISIFIIVGIFLPIGDWGEIGWLGAAALAGALLLRRLVTLLLIGKLLRPGLRLSESLFMGWFGAVGIAALFYVMYAVKETGNEELWPLVSIVIVASVVLHGLSSTPFAQLLGKTLRKRGESTSPPPIA